MNTEEPVNPYLGFPYWNAILGLSAGLVIAFWSVLNFWCYSKHVLQTWHKLRSTELDQFFKINSVWVVRCLSLERSQRWRQCACGRRDWEHMKRNEFSLQIHSCSKGDTGYICRHSPARNAPGKQSGTQRWTFFSASQIWFGIVQYWTLTNGIPLQKCHSFFFSSAATEAVI